MLTTRLLAAIQNKARVYLTSTATIEREERVIGLLGEVIRTNVVVASSVPCRVIQANEVRSDRHSTAASVEALPETYKIAFPAGTALGVDYQVTVGGVTYSIINVETVLTDAVFVMCAAVRR